MSEPPLAERAKQLVAAESVGTLSTHSRRFEGYPFGSVTLYVADRLGRPVFFISTMAMHTQNLQADWRASLLVTAATGSGDSMESGRVTLLGRVEQIAGEAVREMYFERHPRARQWQDFSDFSFYRLYPSEIYFVGGFGTMSWVSADEFAAAGRLETPGYKLDRAVP